MHLGRLTNLPNTLQRIRSSGFPNPCAKGMGRFPNLPNTPTKPTIKIPDVKKIKTNSYELRKKANRLNSWPTDSEIRWNGIIQN